MAKRIRVTTGARLHFGLLRPTEQAGVAFGGIGMMVDQPKTVVELCLQAPHELTQPPTDLRIEFNEHAPQVLQRLIDVTERWRQLPRGQAVHGSLKISIVHLPVLHTGLGTGTQLALAVSLGLMSLSSSTGSDFALDYGQVAALAGRGKRSAIGTHGFFRGGLLSDRGTEVADVMDRMRDRVDLPTSWRIVLLEPAVGDEAVTGLAEEQHFANCPVPGADAVSRLEALREQIVELARSPNEFTQFAAAVTAYNHDAGLFFAKAQGGAYRGQSVSELVSKVRALGDYGVGQSSWGPTVFAICRDHQHAELLVRAVGSDVLRCQIASPRNQGARVEWLS